MELTITVNQTKHTLPPLKMGLWREIQKIKSTKDQSRDKLIKQVDKLANVRDETAFDLLAKRVEVNLADTTGKELKQMARIIVAAFGNDFTVDELLAEIDAETVALSFAVLDIAIMELINEKGDEMPPPKGKSSINFSAMTEYQQVLHLYGLLHREMHWSRDEIDNEEIDYVFDLFVAQARGNIEPEVPIDQIL